MVPCRSVGATSHCVTRRKGVVDLVAPCDRHKPLHICDLHSIRHYSGDRSRITIWETRAPLAGNLWCSARAGFPPSHLPGRVVPTDSVPPGGEREGFWTQPSSKIVDTLSPTRYARLVSSRRLGSPVRRIGSRCPELTADPERQRRVILLSVCSLRATIASPKWFRNLGGPPPPPRDALPAVWNGTCFHVGSGPVARGPGAWPSRRTIP